MPGIKLNTDERAKLLQAQQAGVRQELAASPASEIHKLTVGDLELPAAGSEWSFGFAPYTVMMIPFSVPGKLRLRRMAAVVSSQPAATSSLAMALYRVSNPAPNKSTDRFLPNGSALDGIGDVLTPMLQFRLVHACRTITVTGGSPNATLYAEDLPNDLELTAENGPYAIGYQVADANARWYFGTSSLLSPALALATAYPTTPPGTDIGDFPQQLIGGNLNVAQSRPPAYFILRSKIGVRLYPVSLELSNV